MDEKVTVTVGDDHVGDITRVVSQLEAEGMKVDQVLEVVGVITGSVTSERRAAIERLPGVVSVESEHTFQIPPPDAEVQ